MENYLRQTFHAKPCFSLGSPNEERGEEAKQTNVELTPTIFPRTLHALEKQNDEYYLINNFA